MCTVIHLIQQVLCLRVFTFVFIFIPYAHTENYTNCYKEKHKGFRTTHWHCANTLEFYVPNANQSMPFQTVLTACYFTLCIEYFFVRLCSLPAPGRLNLGGWFRSQGLPPPPLPCNTLHAALKRRAAILTRKCVWDLASRTHLHPLSWEWGEGHSVHLFFYFLFGSTWDVFNPSCLVIQDSDLDIMFTFWDSVWMKAFPSSLYLLMLSQVKCFCALMFSLYESR